SDGRKMSKSLRNYPDVNEVFERDGSDAMRWFLMASPILRGGNLVVTEEGIRDGVRQVLLPLWSTWYFFTLYAGAARDGAGLVARPLTPEGIGELPVMDRYLLARTRSLVEEVTTQLDTYDVPGACEAVRVHLDVLTNWYVRTSRQRFWDEDEAAFSTLATALEVLTRVMAPLAPLLTEEVWRGLTGGRSVHLTDWPVLTDADGGPTALGAVLVADDALVAAVDRVREICSVTLGLRKASGLRVRQPLRELAVALHDPAAVAPYVSLIESELNVKHLTLVDLAEVGPAELGVTSRLAVNARAAGPRLGKRVQEVIRAAKAGDWQRDGEVVVVSTPTGPVPLEAGEYELATVVADRAGAGALDQVAAVLGDGGVVLLDTALDDEMLAEGWARDVVRLVQDARKAAGLQVSDRIRLGLVVAPERTAAAEAHTAMIAHETLATEVTVEPGDVGADTAAITLERLTVTAGRS
ncbi:MAG: Isoleucyl-tRNA synthetase, partial [Actinotalea sp.]|nr:Isoleucyl-tRNA synthetase [Actinotalea sp.]